MEQILGNNKVKSVDLDKNGRILLGTGPYEYFCYVAKKNTEVVFDELSSFTLYLLEADDITQISIQNVNEKLNVGDGIQFENEIADIKILNGSASFLIAGTKKSHPDKKGIFFSKSSDLYRVDKPWGHELWINGEHPCYAFKGIFVKASTKTSLQYHNIKQETIVLFEGEALLYYKKNASVPNDDVTSNDLGNIKLVPISSNDVHPGTIHRLEALTDIMLFETSTPHLDDVVRISDDSNRKDGRVDSEHISSKS